MKLSIEALFYFSKSDDFLVFTRGGISKNQIMFYMLGSGEQILMLTSDKMNWKSLRTNEAESFVQEISSAVIQGLSVNEIDEYIESIIPDIRNYC